MKMTQGLPAMVMTIQGLPVTMRMTQGLPERMKTIIMEMREMKRRRRDFMLTMKTPELTPGQIFKKIPQIQYRGKNGSKKKPPWSSHVEVGGGNVRKPCIKKMKRGF
jgi:hypothetical protein